MTMQHEILFERLLPKYERAFGDAPPVEGLPVDEAVKIIQDRLAMQMEESERLTDQFGLN